MNAILWIAHGTLRECLRERSVHLILVFAALLVLASLVLADMSLGQRVYVVTALSVGATQVFGVFLAVFVGGGFLQREFQRRTILALLSKPIPREAFVLGKFVGFAGLLAGFAVLMAFLLGILLLTEGVPVADVLAGVSSGFAALWFEWLIVLALALMMAVWTGPQMGALVSLGFWLALQIAPEIARQLALRQSFGSPEISLQAASWVVKLLPDLSGLNAVSKVMQGGGDWAYLPIAACLGSSFVFLGLACIIIKNRDLQ
jgi:Cu-processing system permease protein